LEQRFPLIGPSSGKSGSDALEFSNGTVVLVTDLIPGQKAKVLQIRSSNGLVWLSLQMEIKEALSGSGPN
jgi:hypothetical protein